MQHYKILSDGPDANQPVQLPDNPAAIVSADIPDRVRAHIASSSGETAANTTGEAPYFEELARLRGQNAISLELLKEILEKFNTVGFEQIRAEIRAIKMEVTLRQLDSISKISDSEKVIHLLIKMLSASLSAETALFWEVHEGKLRLASSIVHHSESDADNERHLGGQEISQLINGESLAGYVAEHRETIRIDDVYNLAPDSPYAFDNAIDQITGLTTKSVLAVPVIDADGKLVGVIELRNRIAPPDMRLNADPSITTAEGSIIQFTDTCGIITRLAANIAMNTKRHLEAIEREKLEVEKGRQLQVDFLEAHVIAMDWRDKYTSDHTFNVLKLVMHFAEIINQQAEGMFAERKFGQEEMRTLRLAALVHDYLKILIPEEVLTKEKKLYDRELRRIIQRLEAAEASAKDKLQIGTIEAQNRIIAAQGQKSDALQALLVIRDRADVSSERESSQWAIISALDQEIEAAETEILQLNDNYPREVAELADDVSYIKHANGATGLTNAAYDGQVERIKKIAAKTYLDKNGNNQQLLFADEVESLLIRRGTLTAAEFVLIKNHTSEIGKIFGALYKYGDMGTIFTIASSHHEQLSGKGYPKGLAEEQIPFEGMMLAICDIFEALTAVRPYKAAKTIEETLQIMRAMAESRNINGDLLELFIKAEAWRALG